MEIKLIMCSTENHVLSWNKLKLCKMNIILLFKSNTEEIIIAFVGITQHVLKQSNAVRKMRGGYLPHLVIHYNRTIL